MWVVGPFPDVIDGAKFNFYCTNSFWVAEPRKSGISIDLRGDLHNSYQSIELCYDML